MVWFRLLPSFCPKTGIDKQGFIDHNNPMFQTIHFIASIWESILNPSAPPTGNEIHNDCTNIDREILASAYFSGVKLRIENPESPHYQRICFPKNVAETQLKDIVCKSIKDHPETRHEDADNLAIASWYIAFPCPKPPDIDIGNSTPIPPLKSF